MPVSVADWFARLHKQRLVYFEIFQGLDNFVIALPVSRGLPNATVHDQVLRAFGDFRVEIVHQHSQRGLGEPAFAIQPVACWRFDYPGRRFGHSQSALMMFPESRVGIRFCPEFTRRLRTFIVRVMVNSQRLSKTKYRE